MAPARAAAASTAPDQGGLLRPEPLPVERILFESALVRIGAFRCASSHPLFVDSGPIVNPVFVFPRTAVWLHHEGGEPFVADPTVATLYNRSQVYRRKVLSRAGDSCDWFALAPSVLAEIARAWTGDMVTERLFPIARTPVDHRTYFAQRRLVERCRFDGIEPLEMEERVIWLARRVLHGAWSRARGAPLDPPVETARAERRHRDHVEHAREEIAVRFREALSLGDVAAAVGVSPFHLCRMFRRHTGSTLHAYRSALRLRHALDRLGDGPAGLTDLALAVGFSSHSHFTAAFRRAFGVVPSALAPGGGDRTSALPRSNVSDSGH